MGSLLLVRVSDLAVVRNHVHSCIEVHRIDAIAAVDGVYPRVIVGVDHVVTGASVHRVVAAVAANPVSAASSRESVVGATTSNVVGSLGADEGVSSGGAIEGRARATPLANSIATTPMVVTSNVTRLTHSSFLS